MAHEKDFVTFDLTSSAADLLASLGKQLQFLSDHLTPSLTPAIVEKIASKVDQTILAEVG